MRLTDRIVLPVSAVKTEATRVFDALAAGHTVYVSKHGDIIAAFRPIDYVPMAVAAAYVVPGVKTAELTARAIRQAAPSAAVNEAILGMPSLVTRDHEVFGVLTAANPPAATDAVPDLDAAAKRSEDVRTYLLAHPRASIEDIGAYRAKLDEQTAALPSGDSFQEEVIDVSEVAAEAVAKDLQLWRNRGSVVEGPVQEFLAGMRKLFTSAFANAGFPLGVTVGVGALASVSVVHLIANLGASVSGATNKKIGATAASPRAAAALRKAADLLGDDPVGARAVYVTALAAEPDREPGVMWRLGDLARTQGYTAEASAWYGLALGWENQPEVAEAAHRSPVTG